MHDIWNPWHGCVKVSEGCAHCYMYYLDKVTRSGGWLGDLSHGEHALPAGEGSERQLQDPSRRDAACLHDERFLSRRSGRLARRSLGGDAGAAGCGLFSADEAAGARA